MALILDNQLVREPVPQFEEETATSIIRRYGYLKKPYPHIPHDYDCPCCRLLGDKRCLPREVEDIFEERAKGGMSCGLTQYPTTPRGSTRPPPLLATPSIALRLMDRPLIPPPPKDLISLRAQNARNKRRARNTPVALTVVVHRGVQLPIDTGSLGSVLVRCGMYEGQTTLVRRRKNKVLSWEERFTLPVLPSEEHPLEIYVLQGNVRSEKDLAACVGASYIDNEALHSEERGLKERIPMRHWKDMYNDNAQGRGHVEMSWHMVDLPADQVPLEGVKRKGTAVPSNKRRSSDEPPVEEVPAKAEEEPSMKISPISLRLTVAKVLLTSPTAPNGQIDGKPHKGEAYITLHHADGSCSEAATLYRDESGTVSSVLHRTITSAYNPSRGTDGESTGLIEEVVSDRLIQLLCCFEANKPAEATDADAEALALDVVGAVTLDVSQLQGVTEGNATLTITSKGVAVGKVMLSWVTQAAEEAQQLKEEEARRIAEAKERIRKLEEEREARRIMRRENGLQGLNKEDQPDTVLVADRKTDDETQRDDVAINISPSKPRENDELGLSVVVIRGVNLTRNDGQPLVRPSVCIAVGPMEATTHPITEEKYERNEFSSDEENEEGTAGDQEQDPEAAAANKAAKKQQRRCIVPCDIIWNQEMRFFNLADENGNMPETIEVFVFEEDETAEDGRRCVSYGEALLSSEVSSATVVNVYSTEKETGGEGSPEGMARPLGQIILKYRWDTRAHMLEAMGLTEGDAEAGDDDEYDDGGDNNDDNNNNNNNNVAGNENKDNDGYNNVNGGSERQGEEIDVEEKQQEDGESDEEPTHQELSKQAEPLYKSSASGSSTSQKEQLEEEEGSEEKEQLESEGEDEDEDKDEEASKKKDLPKQPDHPFNKSKTDDVRMDKFDNFRRGSTSWRDIAEANRKLAAMLQRDESTPTPTEEAEEEDVTPSDAPLPRPQPLSLDHISQISHMSDIERRLAASMPLSRASGPLLGGRSHSFTRGSGSLSATGAAATGGAEESWIPSRRLNKKRSMEDSMTSQTDLVRQAAIVAAEEIKKDDAEEAVLEPETTADGAADGADALNVEGSQSQCDDAEAQEKRFGRSGRDNYVHRASASESLSGASPAVVFHDVPDNEDDRLYDLMLNGAEHSLESAIVLNPNGTTYRYNASLDSRRAQQEKEKMRRPSLKFLVPPPAPVVDEEARAAEEQAAQAQAQTQSSAGASERARTPRIPKRDYTPCMIVGAPWYPPGKSNDDDTHFPIPLKKTLRAQDNHITELETRLATLNAQIAREDQEREKLAQQRSGSNRSRSNSACLPQRSNRSTPTPGSGNVNGHAPFTRGTSSNSARQQRPTPLQQRSASNGNRRPAPQQQQQAVKPTIKGGKNSVRTTPKISAL